MVGTAVETASLEVIMGSGGECIGNSLVGGQAVGAMGQLT